MEVPIKKRKEEITFIQMALCMVGLNVSYQAADLINESLIILKKKKGKMNLLDSVKIQSEWEKKWDEFFKVLRKEQEKDK